METGLPTHPLSVQTQNMALVLLAMVTQARPQPDVLSLRSGLLWVMGTF